MSEGAPDFTPKSQQGIIVVESDREGHYFVPTMRCGDDECAERECLVFVQEPMKSEPEVRRFATGKGPFTGEWQGVLYCMECERIAKVEFSDEDVLEHTAEEWREYLKERAKYGLDV